MFRSVVVWVQHILSNLQATHRDKSHKSKNMTPQEIHNTIHTKFPPPEGPQFLDVYLAEDGSWWPLDDGLELFAIISSSPVTSCTKRYFVLPLCSQHFGWLVNGKEKQRVTWRLDQDQVSPMTAAWSITEGKSCLFPVALTAEAHDVNTVRGMHTTSGFACVSMEVVWEQKPTRHSEDSYAFKAPLFSEMNIVIKRR